MTGTSRSSQIPPPPPLPEDFRRRVVVRIREGVDLPYEDHAEVELLGRGLLPWDELTERLGPLSLDRVFFSVTELELTRLERQANEKNPSRRRMSFRRYFEVECPADASADKLAERLESYPVVERAYVATIPMWPPAVTPGNDPLSPTQYYLDPAPAVGGIPGGVGAAEAWAVPGGDGAGVDLVDIEEGWNLKHEDLSGANIQLLSGFNRTSKGHGTSVLGIIRADDNALGCIGLAPAARVSVASQWRRRVRPRYSTEDALVSVANSRSPGGIVLLEAQTLDYLPMETEDAIFLAIELMTSNDITVIVCAGNGDRDLDAYRDGLGRYILARGDPGFRDSGAIMVAASTSGIQTPGQAPTPARSRIFPSNYGTRIDCFAWGEDVVTTGDGSTGTGVADYLTLPYAFGGTSAAGAIVAGVAACVQGIARQHLGQFLSARKMRGVLTDPLLGTPSANPAADRIGQMPDLRLLAGRVTSGVALPY